MPVNQSSDSVDRDINVEAGDIRGSTTDEIGLYEEVDFKGGDTNTGGLTA